MRVVLGVGGRPGGDADELAALVRTCLVGLDLAVGDVSVVATLDRRAAEPGVRDVAGRLGARVVAVDPHTLAAQDVPHPSELVRRHTAASGVAEAAVLAVGARLLASKRRSAAWTVAVGRLETTEEDR
ncbi:MAG TPA: cobalamin biosynthesis protein [Intrasporangium sp.]|uniref:cobalamin biosynthesis protein n=1 Tax=Intrasporangium sp. TaxID=1925024 RepID=UPI002D78A0C3|nr:cobalamin biosynthesis protein [Intrasporangium sp.]HET7399635.1 cobalamin biosynthesis protein [Intrasporangium sp.]